MHSTFAYGDAPNPLKMYRGKDATFPQKPMAELTDALKREHEAAEKCHICLKEFNGRRNRKVRDHCHFTGLYRGARGSQQRLQL